MATLNELMAEVGLSVSGNGHTKEAQAPKSVNEEISKVLENLGLGGDAETIKTASEATQNEENGGPMGLTSIYEGLFGEEAAAAVSTHQEKTASEHEEGDVSASDVFGQLAAAYFGVAKEEYVEKVAADLEAAAGAGHDPMASLGTGGQLTGIIGKEKSPRLPVNAQQGESHDVTTGGTSPYNLALAQVKQILKRSIKTEPGVSGGYNQ